MTAPKPPGQLVDHIKQGKCVVFVGAGLSMQAALPSWGGLLDQMVQRLDNLLPRETEELKQLLERGKLLEVAEYCKHKDKTHFNSILKRLVRGDDCPVPEAHRILARIPFSGVVTTNYDKLLERGWRSENEGEPLVLTHADSQALGELLVSGGFFLLKAHGDIDRPKSIVLTAKDYQEIIHGDTAFESVFSAILMTRVVLFIGYSLNDPDFKLMMEAPLRRFEGIVAPRYALMSGMGEIERSVLYSISGVKVISYDNQDGTHGEVVDFLKRLEELTAAATTPTWERAAARAAGATTPMPERVSAPSEPRPAAAGRAGSDAPVLTVTLDGDELRSTLASGGGGLPIAAGSAAPPKWQELRAIMSWTLSQRPLEAGALAKAGSELTKLVDPQVIRRAAELPEGTELGLEVSSELQNLPWEWLQLPIAGEESRFLAQHLSCYRRRMGNLGPRAGTGGFSGRSLRVLLIADPTGEGSGFPQLPGALRECEEIQKLLESDDRAAEVDLLAGDDATYENLADRLRSGAWDIVHFAGHAWADAQSSFLILAGAEYLRPMDLSYLIRSQPPILMFLNSHFTSYVPLGLEERLASKHGFTSTGSGHSGFAMMAAQTWIGAFIGTSHESLSDIGAGRFAVGLYQELLKGTPVARALWSVSKKRSAEEGDARSYEELFYLLLGEPWHGMPGPAVVFETK